MAADIAAVTHDPPADAPTAAEPAAITVETPRVWDLLGRLEKGASGTRLPDGSLQVERAESPGCGLFGPYLHLREGRYRLSFRCRNGAPRWAAQPLLGVEIIVLSRFQRAWRDFDAAELAAGIHAIDFAVPREHSLEGGNEGRFEFRFFHFGNADLKIDAVTLEMLPADDAAVAPPATARRWRLLGRQQTSWIGRRASDGSVGVWRAAPAGCVLFGVWPYLRLARGAYRLTVRAQAGAPRHADKPMLNIEVRGQCRWFDRRPVMRLARLPETTDGVSMASHAVSAADLAAGSAALDFVVPDDFALEAGADAPFDIRLHHAGNAALRIEAVDLVRLDDSTVQAPALVRVGGLARRRKVVIVGNCQSETLRQGLANTEAVNRLFEVKYHFVQLPKNLHEFAARDLETCDVLLIQDVRLWEQFPLRDAVRPGADTAKFPLVRFGSLWPFDAWNGPGDKEAHNREAPNLTFPYLDGLLGRLRREIADPEERFRAYRSLDLPRIPNYLRLHELEERRLAAVDQEYGIAIGAFILENFRKRRIFHTTVRPDWQVFGLLLQYVAGLLGIKEPVVLSKNADVQLRNPQVPVHPKVARDLGVEWADENTGYLSHGIEVTWEQYIRRYIAHYG